MYRTVVHSNCSGYISVLASFYFDRANRKTEHKMVYWEGYLYLVVYFVNRVQDVLDFLLNLVLGYKTRSGWSNERKTAETKYEKSAQMVNGKTLPFFSFWGSIRCPFSGQNSWPRRLQPDLVPHAQQLCLHARKVRDKKI